MRDDAQGQDALDVGHRTGAGDECHALVAVEAGQGRQRSALQLDHRNAQGRGVDDELIKRGASLRDDEQANRVAARGERLLDWAASGDQLLIFG